MNRALHLGCVVLCFASLNVLAASPAAAPVAAKAPEASPLAGEFHGRWQSSGEGGGAVRLEFRQEQNGWVAQHSFTVNDVVVPTKVVMLKVENRKVEFVIEWTIDTTMGRSKVVGELKDDVLSGSYESTSGDETTTGTWRATRVTKSAR
jgi:hypothetical protein